MKKVIRLIGVIGLIVVLGLGVDWPERKPKLPFDISPYLNSPSDKPGSGPKKGMPYTPD